MTDLDMPVSQGTRDWWDRLANGRPYMLVRHDSIRPGDRAISSYYGEVTATAYIGDGIDGHQGQINWVTPESASDIWHERCDNDVPIALLTRADHDLPPERHTLACIQSRQSALTTYGQTCPCQAVVDPAVLEAAIAAIAPVIKHLTGNVLPDEPIAILKALAAKGLLVRGLPAAIDPGIASETAGAPRSTGAQHTLPEHLLVGECARCGAPCIIPATDPDNAEMEVCAACHGDVIRDLTNGTAEGR